MNKFRVGLRVLAELGLYGIIGHIEEAIKLLGSTLNNITSCDTVRSETSRTSAYDGNFILSIILQWLLSYFSYCV